MKEKEGKNMKWEKEGGGKGDEEGKRMRRGRKGRG